MKNHVVALLVRYSSPNEFAEINSQRKQINSLNLIMLISIVL